MDYKNYISKSGVFFSCTEKAYRGHESIVAEHALVYVYSGSMSVTDINGTFTVGEGETFLFYRSMLANFIKHPSEKAGFKSISILFSRSFLQKFYSLYESNPVAVTKWEARRIEKHPLLTGLFDSILPYYEMHGEALPEELSDIKLQEAITILRAVDNNVDSILSNFGQVGKIDLETFMLKSFSFNIPLKRFAYLSGRSLATFKRDFQKAFNTSPQKWLLEKRLKQAHYLISEKRKKPSDIYLDVGFENQSHFSRKFKQYFGYSPSDALKEAFN